MELYSLKVDPRNRKWNRFYHHIHYLFCISSVIHFASQTHAFNDPINEFTNYEVIVPKLYSHPRIKGDLNLLKNCNRYDENVKIVFGTFNESFEIDLQRNTHLIPSHYFEKHHQNGVHIQSKPHLKNRDHCHYNGRLLNRTGNSWAALSTCNGQISGVFSDGNNLFFVYHDANSNKHLLFKETDLKPTPFKCGADSVSEDLIKMVSLHKSRNIRSIVQDTYKSDLKTRYVELVMVNDIKVFQEYKNDREVVFDRTKRIANIVNALYNQLNIFIALVGVVIWTETNEIEITTDGDVTLTHFLHYRRERLIPLHPNDNAQLITGSSFDGGVVGKALKGPICTYEYSGGVNTDHSHVIGIVATTIAHELGHNFGMEHDHDKCKCPDDKCIMAPSSSSISPKHWSTCSVEYLDEAFKHGMDYCLRNKPQQLMSPVCGNGFLEEGEECDCGLKDYCDNKCCNATSCTLMPGATCAVGSCCDTSTCRIIGKDEGKICRSARNDCDLFEVCDGISEFCPEDVYVQDGTPCVGGVAYCYEGRCATHEDQCKLLWGPTGEVSDHNCYKQNTRGNATGNCGYNFKYKNYTTCESKDIMCGTLHCVHKNERLEFGMESAAILSRSFISIDSRGKILTCRSAIIDLGLESGNPGLVPNGAKCGPNAMCVNQKCYSVSTLLAKKSCYQNCNNNGLCDNKGHCHCFPGFAPPFCEFALPGGYFFTVAMYIIFLCILPITGIGAFLLYHYHDGIKTWWLIKARKTAIKSRAKQITHRKPPRPPPNFNAETSEISYPIPMESDSEFIAITTLPKIVPKKQRPNTTRNLKISAPITNDDKSSNDLIKPIRPAPPPPPPAPQSVSSDFSRSSSMRSSRSSTRPSVPPPRPPKPIYLNQNSLSDGDSNTGVERNKLTSPLMYADHINRELAELRAADAKKNINFNYKIPERINGFKQNELSKSRNEKILNTDHVNGGKMDNKSLVASLTQKFERIN